MIAAPRRGPLTHLAEDLRLYPRLIAMQLRAQAQYKVSLALSIAVYLLVTGVDFFALLILFGRFPTLLGWRVGEVALVYGLSSISFGVAEMIGAGIDRFDQIVRRGDFDRVLLRPVGVLLQVVAGDFLLRRLGRITQGVLVLALALHLLPGLRWTPARLVALSLGVLSGSAVFLGVLLLGATLCFWTVETTELTNVLTYGGCYLLAYPLDIYARGLQRIFLFVIPLAIGSYVPACYVLGRPLVFGLPNSLVFAAPPIALAFVLATMAVWRLGVRRYQSTGS